MPGGHRGQQCTKKGLTRIHPFPLADEEEALSREAIEGICRKVTMTCLRFMFLLCKTFQACAVATTKSDV